MTAGRFVLPALALLAGLAMFLPARAQDGAPTSLTDLPVRRSVCANRAGPAERIEDCTAAIKQGQPPDRLIEAYRDRAWAYEETTQLEKAIGDLSSAIALMEKQTPQPDFLWETLLDRANLLCRTEHCDRAIPDADRAVSIHAWPGAFDARGHLYLNLDQYERAIADFDQAIRLDPEWINSVVGRGVANYSLGRFDQALEDFDAAIAWNRERAGPTELFYRGLIRSSRGRYAEAIEDFTRTIEWWQNLYAEKIELPVRACPLAEAYYQRGMAKKTMGKDGGGDEDLASATSYRALCDERKLTNR